MKKLGISFFLLLVLAFGCNTNSDKTPDEASKMYESTPLALLMLRMHGDALGWKGAIEADVFETKFSSDYYGIYTVEATDPKVRNEVFEEHADLYIERVKDLMETDKQKKQIKKFNLMVTACIDCHAVFCQGPIDKIKKLYIAQND